MNYRGLIIKNIHKTPLAASVGIAFVTLLSAASVTAEMSPFSMTELSDGYMQIAEVSSGYTVKPFFRKPKRGDMNMDAMNNKMNDMKKGMSDMKKGMNDMNKGMSNMNKEMRDMK